jgi:dynein regulatory complex protein 1
MNKGGTEEFSTNVTNKEDRIKARKNRIVKRNAAESNGSDEAVDTGAGGNNKTGSQQVTDSLFHLDRRKFTGLKDVTGIRVTTDENESNRRIQDETLRRDRLAKLQHEALASAKANAAVEMKWAEIHEKEIPQELYTDIQAQIVACNAIIRSKDELITEFQRQLRSKDEEYVRTLRQQGEDIEDLLTRIRREFKEMQSEYDKELETIDEAYSDERDRMIADHVNEIDNMFDMRRNKETYYKDTKQKREEQYQRELDDLITKGADQYNKLKIELELNIQTLKQQLEEIRATYQLNTEKLDYNYRVLTELDVEKNAELTRYKRRLTKLKDQLNQLVTKFTEMEAADTKMNHELTEDYRSLTQKYKDLQAKFRHFEVADTNKYDEVWVMHEDEAKDLVDQLLKADKIITEQQLNWRWKDPDMHALQQVLGRHGTLGIAVGAAAQAANAAPNAEGNEEGGGAGAAGASANTPIEDGPNSKPQQAHITRQQSVRDKERKIAGTRIRGVLKMLATEAGFLVNEQVMKAIADMPDEEVGLRKAEVMLKALGVKSDDKLNTLVSYFFKDNSHGAAVSSDHEDFAYAHNENGEEMGIDYEEELNLHHAPEDVMELREMIRAEDVIAAVKAYIEVHRTQ